VSGIIVGIRVVERGTKIEVKKTLQIMANESGLGSLASVARQIEYKETTFRPAITTTKKADETIEGPSDLSIQMHK
jgi:hypothetical protein